jgi:effector-associated domain 7 (EAD7)-containing protein
MVLGFGKEKQECKHLIKYDGTKVEVSGVSFQGFQVGGVSVEQKLLQATSQALMLLDASQFHLCEAVKGAPDEESKKRYYDLMIKDRMRAQDIIMGLAALSVNPDSKQVEDALTKMLLENHARALEIEKDEVQVAKQPVAIESNSALQIGQDKFETKVEEVKKAIPSSVDELQKVKTQPKSEIDHVGLFHLLTDKFDREELKTLAFESKVVDYDDLAGETKQAKARELILYLKRRDKLNNFYDFLTDYLAKR